MFDNRELTLSMLVQHGSIILRNARFPYQHVIAIFPLQTASLNTKNAHAHTLYKHVYITYKYSQFLDTLLFFLLRQRVLFFLHDYFGNGKRTGD